MPSDGSSSFEPGQEPRSVAPGPTLDRSVQVPTRTGQVPHPNGANPPLNGGESPTQRGRVPHSTEAAVAEVGDRPSGRETLALEPGHRPLIPPLDDPAGQPRLGVEHARPSGRRSRPSRWPAATPRPGASRSAPARRTRAVTRRRLWWRVLCHGSGKNVQSSARWPGATRCSTAQTASTRAQADVLDAGVRERREGRGDPGPPDLEGQHVVRRAASRQSATVASPTPEPISTTSGASRPNQSARSNPGRSTASSGITQSALWASHAACWRGVSRLPAAGVAEHLPDPAPVRRSAGGADGRAG